MNSASPRSNAIAAVPGAQKISQVSQRVIDPSCATRLAAVLAALILASGAVAQTWSGGVDSTWGTAGNWNPVSVPNDPAADANFLTATSGDTIDVDGTFSVERIYIADTHRLENGTLNLGGSIISVATAATPVIASNLSLTDFVAVANAGFSADGAPTSLELAGTVSADNAAGTLLSVSANDPASRVIVPGTLQDGTGPLRLEKLGDGTGRLIGTSNYSGNTTLRRGTLELASATALPNAGAVVVDGGTLRLDGMDQTIGSLAGTGGTVDLGNNTLITGGNDATNSFAGTIVGAGGALVKAGAGALTLSGANTYGGGTNAAAGTLVTGGANALGAGAVTVDAGATLQTTASEQINQPSVLTLDGTLELGGNENLVGLDGAGTGTVTLGANRLILGTTGGTFAGAIGGSGGVSVIGGTQTLQGTNSFTGSAEMNGGTMVLNAGGTLATRDIRITGTGAELETDGSALVSTAAIQNAGTLDIIGGTESVALVSGAGGVTLNGGTLQLNSGASEISGVISGSGALEVAGSIVTLSGDNTFSGGTVVSAGTLLVNGSLGNAPISVADGAVLGGTGSIAGAVTINGNGQLAPGASAGTLTTGNLILNQTSILDYELAAPGMVGGGVNDLTQANGDLTLDGVLNVTDIGGLGPGTYTLMTYTGTLTDNGLDLNSLPAGFDATITASGNEVILEVVALEPGIDLSLAPADFGEVRVDTDSDPLTVTLSNPGNAELNVTGLTEAAAPFDRTGDGSCGDVPFPVDPGQSCTLVYTFSPSETGEAPQTLTLESDAPSSPDTFALVGTGIEPGIDLSLAPADFGEVRVETDSDPLTVTIDNPGDAELNVAGLTEAAAPFDRTGAGSCSDAPFPVDPGQSCTLVYTFSPSETGEANQKLTLESDAPSSSDAFDLTGVGVESQVSLSSTTLDFDLLRRSEVARQTLILTNSGTTTLNIEAITGPDEPFSIVPDETNEVATCTDPGTLEPDESCGITVEFAPGVLSGTFTASFDIVSDAASSPNTVILRAFAQAMPVPVMDRFGMLLLVLLMGTLAAVAARSAPD